jgi:hypothetical protein
LLQTTVNSSQIETQQIKEVIDVLAEFAPGLNILDGYDHQNLSNGEINPATKYVINYNDARQAIEELRLKYSGAGLLGNEKD